MGWFGRKARLKHPRVVLDVTPEGLRAHLELPDLAGMGVQEMGFHAENLAATVGVLASGGDPVLAMLQSAVGHGATLSGNEQWGQYVLRLVNGLSARQDHEPFQAPPGPLVSPSQAFTQQPQ